MTPALRDLACAVLLCLVGGWVDAVSYLETGIFSGAMSGNTVLLGQRERSASQAPAEDEGQIRFSILQEAAALVSSRGGAPQACQISAPDDRSCPSQAEVKLADSLGDSAWVCLKHAEEILVTFPAAFIASHNDRGIAAFLAGR